MEAAGPRHHAQWRSRTNVRVNGGHFEHNFESLTFCCVLFVSSIRYGSNITNVWQEILTPMTLAFSDEVVHDKVWKSVNMCKSCGEKISGTFLCGHGVYYIIRQVALLTSDSRIGLTVHMKHQKIKDFFLSTTTPYDTSAAVFVRHPL